MNRQDRIEHERQARDIFFRAVEIVSAQDRAAFLEATCGQDQALRSRVNALLDNAGRDEFLEDPALKLRAGSEKPGSRIDRYKLLQKIGEGGMGVVYMAEQEEPVRRRVALKIIKLRLPCDQKLRSKDHMTTKTAEIGRRPLAFSYERCSCSKQVDGDTERRQWEENRVCAEQFGFELSEQRFFDAGVSAYRGRNFEANLGRILERIQPGQGLIFNDMDRFSRQNWKAAADFLEKFLLKGVVVMTSRNRQQITLESFRKDPGSFLPVIMASHLGHAEDAKKAYYVRKAWEVKRAEIREGKAIRQRLPGWLSHEKRFEGGRVVLGKIIVDEAKAATIREIFRLTLAGWSRRRIAQDFNARGVPPVSGQSDKWNGASLLATIIRNPAVIGHYRVIENKKFTGEVIKDLLPALVDERTFYAANASATANKKLTIPTRAVSQCMVTGLVRCPYCCGNMSHQTSCHSETKKVYHYLVCSRSKVGQSNDARCKIRVNYDDFERTMLDYMSMNNLLEQVLNQQPGVPDELSAMQGRLQTLDAKLNQIAADYEATPSKALGAILAKVEAEAEQLRGELQNLEARTKAAPTPAMAYRKFCDALRAYLKLAYKLQAPEGRQAVKTALRQVIDHFELHDRKRFTVVFKGGYRQRIRMTP